MKKKKKINRNDPFWIACVQAAIPIAAAEFPTPLAHPVQIARGACDLADMIWRAREVSDGTTRERWLSDQNLIMERLRG